MSAEMGKIVLHRIIVSEDAVAMHHHIGSGGGGGGGGINSRFISICEILMPKTRHKLKTMTSIRREKHFIQRQINSFEELITDIVTTK